MKARKPLLKTLLARVFGAKAAPQPAPAPSPFRKPAQPRPVTSSIEGLEGRIAPASLIDLRTVLYQDFDGDMVTVKFSKNVFQDAGIVGQFKANEVLKFATGNVNQDTTATQQLQLIDFTKFTAFFGSSIANGVSLSITAVQTVDDMGVVHGNGLADVGAIKATNVNLGAISIDGDLGQIDAGTGGAKTALASLTVGSLGTRGISTQIPVPSPTVANPAPDLISNITGALGSLKVLGDVEHASVNVLHGRNQQGQLTTLGNLGPVTILGSLIGNPALGAASDRTGVIYADGNIGAIKIGTDLTDGIVGGGGLASGNIGASGAIASLTISGSILGGPGSNSGVVFSSGNLGTVKIGGDLQGGGGLSSGNIRALGKVGAITIGDDITAGTGESSGAIVISATTGAILVKGDIDGSPAIAAGIDAARIFAFGKIASLTLNGSLLGGATDHTGFIESATDIGAVKILGNIDGGAGDASGAIIAGGKIASFTLAGHLAGGGGFHSGAVLSGIDTALSGDMGAVKISGFLAGGTGDNSGAILSGGKLASLTLGGKTTLASDILIGGIGDYSGTVSSRGAMGAVKISGNIAGAAGDFSASLISLDRTTPVGEFAGDIAAVTITGSITGGAGIGSARFHADGNLASLTSGAWLGGTGQGSASIETGAGLLHPGKSGAIKINGTFGEAAVTPGIDSASISIGSNLASLTFTGAVTGGTVHVGDALAALTLGADATDLTVTARGQLVQGKTADIAIGKITANASVTGSSFLAGYDLTGSAVNPDAQIGAVKVVGNWTASNLIAGVIVGSDPGFGGEFDTIAPGFNNALIVSKIASITIGGTVTGTGAAGDHFGFVAQRLSAVKIGPTTFAMQDAVGQQVFEIGGVNGDVTIREVAVV